MKLSLRLRSIVLIAAVLVSAFAPVLMWPAPIQAALSYTPSGSVHYVGFNGTADCHEVAGGGSTVSYPVTGTQEFTSADHFRYRFAFDQAVTVSQVTFTNNAVATPPWTGQYAPAVQVCYSDVDSETGSYWTQAAAQAIGIGGVTLNFTASTHRYWIVSSYGANQASSITNLTLDATDPATATPTPTITPSPTLTPTLTPTPTPTPATLVWKEGNYIDDGDFSLVYWPGRYPWFGLDTSLALFPGIVDPPALCGSTYRFLNNVTLVPGDFSLPIGYGGILSQEFNWYGGNMYLSLGIRTEDGGTVDLALIDPLGRWQFLESGIANESGSWGIYSYEVADAMLGLYTLVMEMQPNMSSPYDPAGRALIDCVAVTEAGHVQIFDFNSSPLTQPPWFADPVAERIAFYPGLTVAQQEEINDAIAIGIMFTFVSPLTAMPLSSFSAASVSSEDGWTVLRLPPSPMLPNGGGSGWIRPAGLLPGPGGTSGVVIGPNGFIDAAGSINSGGVGQAVSMSWFEVQAPGMITGSSVPGRLGSSASLSIVPNTNALGVSYAVKLPTALSLGEAISYADSMVAVMDVTDSSLILQSNSNYWGQIEVAPMEEVGWYAVTQPLTLPTGQYRLVFQNNSPDEMLLSRLCVAPWTDIIETCPVVAPPSPITMPRINQTLQAAMTRQAATVRAAMTATAAPYQATQTARVAATQTVLAATANSTSQYRATQTQAAALTATPRYAATSTAFVQGFHTTLTARAAATQTRVYGSYTTATAQAIARATQTAVAIAQGNAQATVWAQSTARAALTQQAQTQVALVPHITQQAGVQATINVYGTVYAATNAAAATAVATYANATTIPQATQAAQVVATANAVQNEQATALASAIAQLTAIPNAQSTQQAQSTAIAQTQIANEPTQIAQGTQQALQMPPAQPQPGWQSDCSRPDNPFNLAWWGEYLVCYGLSWFAWSPTNTAQIQDLGTMAGSKEPFGIMLQTGGFFRDLTALIGTVDWGSTGASCSADPPTAAIFLQQARGLLLGDLQFDAGANVLTDEGTLLIEPIVGPFLARGMLMGLNFLCITGLLQWLQWFTNAMLTIILALYIKVNLIDKAMT